MGERPIAVRRWGNRKKVQVSESAGESIPSSSNSSQSDPPVVIIDEDEELESAKKKSRRALDSSVEVERGLAEVKLDGGPEDDEIVDPDIPWRPPAPSAGAITTYSGKPSWDWVVVSKKSGDEEAPMEVPETVFNVEPLQTAVPENFEGEPVVADEEDDDEEAPGDCGFNTEQEFNDAEGADADARHLVMEALEKHQKLRSKFMHEAEDPKRPGDCSMKAAKHMNEKNAWINRARRIGSVPGVDVGDCFYYRVSLCIIGLHHMSQGGISCMRSADKANHTGQLLAISLVLSGGYEDDKDEGDTLLYTGQGGISLKTKKQVEDQKLERGNLGLANSCKFDTPVRVIRGCIDPKSPSSRVYTYDGLYRVTNFWSEPGKAGYKVYRYKLERQPGQSERGSKLVKFCRRLQTRKVARQGVVLEDISGGKEPVPIVVVNEVDPPALPPPFRYITKVVSPLGYIPPPMPEGCRCGASCEPARCSCIARNGDQLPYNRDGTLIDWLPVIYECGPQCRCPPTCPNRVTQRKPTRKLEVFKTANRGWGVRCWEDLPFGTFICEYVGEMINNDEAERRVGNDEYIFDVDCINGNRSRGVDISSFFDDVGGDGEKRELCTRVEAMYSIDAAMYGNVTRFINHSCDPNLFVQCVFSDHHDVKTPHIMLFAMKHIKPFEELSYDYGYKLNSVKDAEGKVKKKACYCGARRCTKRLY